MARPIGTLDQRHVERILSALAEQDGAARMECVAQLDERAPDYDQALGELAAAIQRMALLQALPDLRGEDEEQDRTLTALAGLFAPEDLQLLYQIAIMARRDLDFAPDARGGFEMALLRMLAFRPEPAPSVAPASPAPPPARGESAAPAGAAPASDWSAIVAALGHQGPAGQLAAHCVLVGREKDLVKLKPDCAGEVFRRPQLEQKLAQALAQHFGRAVRLGINVAEEAVVAPARQQAQAADERLKAAEQAIDDDPAVRPMGEVFGATVHPGVVQDRGYRCLLRLSRI